MGVLSVLMSSRDFLLGTQYFVSSYSRRFGEWTGFCSYLCLAIMTTTPLTRIRVFLVSERVPKLFLIPELIRLNHTLSQGNITPPLARRRRKQATHTQRTQPLVGHHQQQLTQFAQLDPLAAAGRADFRGL